MATDGKAADSFSLSIRRSRLLVVIFAMLVVSAYVLWFWLVKREGLSSDPEIWGQFGDYLGGLLNPLVAFAAFYWLTRSVALQKQELAETRAALEATSESQERQATSAQTSVKVAALSALINSIMGEVQIHRMHIQFVLDQAANHHAGTARKVDGTPLSAREIPGYLNEINERITQRMTLRSNYEEQLNRLLE
ncbi:MAG TPA: hypothetical protein VM576_04130 [Xanthomonadaceae bacterium]|nr:hypothetical protein [Xanthomonadaceae bacterium]